MKLFAKDDYELEGLLQTVKKFSDDIGMKSGLEICSKATFLGMKFGLEICSKATFLKGRLEKSTSIELDNSMKIKELEQKEVYKYIGVNS